jgi:tetratricopeptide (TPR) repeat protein
MLGKITGALIRKEADAYRAQGLQEEALALFKKSLCSTPQLPPDVQVAIEQQIQQLEAELAGTIADECEQLSDEQIAVIRKGWTDDASVDELAGSAHALHSMGRFGNALEEFSILIRRGYSPHHIIRAMASCLARLNPPQELVDAVDRLAAGLFQDSKNNFAFKLSLAEEMVKSRFVEHSMELSRHLARHSGIPGAYRIRMEALNKSLKSSFRKTHAPDRKPAGPSGAIPVSPSVIQRIRAAVGKRSPKHSR